MSSEAKWHDPPWSPEPGASQVSPVWAVRTLLLCLGHDCCRCPDGREYSPAKLTESCDYDCCGCADVRGWPPGMRATLEERQCQPGPSTEWGGAGATQEGPAGQSELCGVCPQGNAEAGHVVSAKLMQKRNPPLPEKRNLPVPGQLHGRRVKKMAPASTSFLGENPTV